MRRLIAVLLLLCLSVPARAATYILIDGGTAVQTTPTTGFNRVVQPQVAVTGGSLAAQAFVVWTTGTSCTVQILGSNDGAIFVNYGTTIVANAAGTVVSGSGVNANSAVGTIPFNYFAAIITAISGTGAKCSASLSG